MWTEKAMATHCNTLAWQIPWAEEPCGLQSMGSLRVGHNWVTSLSLFTFMHWRRKWQPTPAFLPEESQRWGSLGGLPSLGSHRVGHDWSNLAAAAAGNLENWFWRSYLQGRNTDNDVETGMQTWGLVGGAEGGTNWESSAYIYPPPR